MAMVIVIGWQVYDIARETMDIREAAFQLGLIGLVQFVPLFVLTPISGWTADRLDRRHIARAVILLELICALILLRRDLGRVSSACRSCSAWPRCSALRAPSPARRSAPWRPTSCRAKSCPMPSR